ncbi:MAG: methyltransferase domain-containing protein [Nocardioides sp.]|nr:methyltransferase domain-containing protein [Nocardioides sp.]
MPVMSRIEGTFCRSAPWRELARRVVLPWALAGEELSGDVLEIGGGSGAMAEGMARIYPDVRLTTTDLDESMVRSARTRLQPFKQVNAKIADVTRLPFADESFDVVASFLMLHHVIDWRPALDEAARVLRPGGLLLGYDLTDTPIARIVHLVDGSPSRVFTAAALRQGLAETGFVKIEVTESYADHLMRFRARVPG